MLAHRAGEVRVGEQVANERCTAGRVAPRYNLADEVGAAARLELPRPAYNGGDRYAGAHTPRTAAGKAWTAASFRTPTTELARISEPGQPQSGLRHLPRAVLLGGGLPIEAQGSILGAIGVSGAPGGAADDTCAQAGIDAIREKIEF